ncbi:MAG: pyridoxal-phosphate dependent enzyme [Armatimonadota bacterium]|nr:pyridoxal-phosphate dependent enzyme [Armatimonadota bacterium]
MRRLGLERELVDATVYEHAVARFREARIVLPTFAELADPGRIAPAIRQALAAVDPDAPHPLNLFRVHWFNDATRRAQVDVPEHLVLPKALTGVDAPIVVALGDRFPMIRAHKVLAAYACLAPRIITGQFDPTAHRAVWPSTGNYARGGVAISRIMGCRGIAVLPEGMSRERFEWLERWVADPADIIRTPGTESNVKEIYDRCAELDREPGTIILNQFSEFGNHLAHYLCTGRALARVFEAAQARWPDLRLAAYVSASGSAGTLGAGDYLKEQFGTRIVAAEALECPTMLRNGFGEHNIQGIGDKHIPLIHNVMNTDVVVAISDRSTDRLDVLFNTDEGRRYLTVRRGVPATLVQQLSALGLSSICNVLGAIKTAKYFGFGPADAVVTVATDGAGMYGTERDKALRKYFPAGFDAVAAGETYGECLLGEDTDNMLDLTHAERTRIFNLGYYTWVEQQGVSIDEFETRRDQGFWRAMRGILPVWDRMIEEFNRRTGATVHAQ